MNHLRLAAGALAGESNKPTELSVEMKRTLFLIALLLVIPNLAGAQTQTRDRRSVSSGSPETRESSAVRSRVVGPIRVQNHAEKQPTTYPIEQKTSVPSADKAQLPAKAPATSEPKWGNMSVITRPGPSQPTQAGRLSSNNNSVAVDRTNRQAPKLVQPTAIINEVKPGVTSQRNVANTRTPAPLRTTVATAVYHVGIGDVLDIRLANLPTRESTLFTVLKNGLLEHPLLNGPISVAGMTTEEIANLLSNEIKVIRAARVSVMVRDYASHTVLVSGLVDSPGRKVLRREAMPLYAVLAEALPRVEATVATVSRGGKTEMVALNNEQQMGMLVMSGDVIKVSGSVNSVKGFVYIGGDVTSPGEKEFREGMTLTQALISAGGIPRSGKTTVKVARRDSAGFLKGNEFNVQSIRDGKTQDPLLQAGDRIEVTRGL